MREILFRGKAINRDNGYHRTNYKNGDWVYGLITRQYDERFRMLPAEMTDIKGVSGIEVDYKTIGQYTGLTDKNGKKVFEGDIIRKTNEGRHPQIFTVNIRTNFRVNEEVYYSPCDHFTESCEYEIIGNIHDNSELLEV